MGWKGAYAFVALPNQPICLDDKYTRESEKKILEYCMLFQSIEYGGMYALLCMPIVSRGLQLRWAQLGN